jgi:hypothetical protein
LLKKIQGQFKYAVSDKVITDKADVDSIVFWL